MKVKVSISNVATCNRCPALISTQAICPWMSANSPPARVGAYGEASARTVFRSTVPASWPGGPVALATVRLRLFWLPRQARIGVSMGWITAGPDVLPSPHQVTLSKTSPMVAPRG